MATKSLSEALAEIRAQQAQSSVYTPIAQSLIQGQLQPQPGYTQRDFILPSILKSALGGVFSGLAKGEARDTNAAIADLLPSVLSGKSVSYSDQSPVSESEFDSLVNSLKILKAQRDIEKQDALETLKNQALYAGSEEYYKEKGKQRAYGIEDLIPPTTSDGKEPIKVEGAINGPANLPLEDLAKLKEVNPVYKGIYEERVRQEEKATKVDEKASSNLLDFRKELAQSVTKGKIPDDFLDIKVNFDTMKGLLPVDTRGADVLFTSSFARISDPGGTVREGEIKTVQDANSFLQKWFGETKSFFTNEGRLLPEAKKALIEAASVKYNSFGNTYQDWVNTNKDLLKKKGGNPDDLISYPFESFDMKSLEGGKAKERPTLTTSEQAAIAEYNLLRDKGVSEAEAKATIKSKYGK